MGLNHAVRPRASIEIRTALLVMVTVLSGYLSARIAATLIAGHIDPYNSAAIAYELTSAALGTWAPKKGTVPFFILRRGGGVPFCRGRGVG